MAYGIYHVPFMSSAAWATANIFRETDRAGLVAGLANGPYQSQYPERLPQGTYSAAAELPLSRVSVAHLDELAVALDVAAGSTTIDLIASLNLVHRKLNLHEVRAISYVLNLFLPAEVRQRFRHNG